MSAISQEFHSCLSTARAIAKKYSENTLAIVESVKTAIMSCPGSGARLFQTSGCLPQYRIDGWICNGWFVGMSCNTACAMRFDETTGLISTPSGYTEYTCEKLVTAIGSLPNEVLNAWIAAEVPIKALKTQKVDDSVEMRITSSGKVMGKFTISRDRIMATCARKYHYSSEISLAVAPLPEQYDLKVTRDLCAVLNGSDAYEFSDWRSHDMLYGLLIKLGVQFA